MENRKVSIFVLFLFCFFFFPSGFSAVWNDNYIFELVQMNSNQLQLIRTNRDHYTRTKKIGLRWNFITTNRGNPK